MPSQTNGETKNLGDERISRVFSLSSFSFIFRRISRRFLLIFFVVLLSLEDVQALSSSSTVRSDLLRRRMKTGFEGRNDSRRSFGEQFFLGFE